MSSDLCHEVLYGRAGAVYALLYVSSLVPGAALETQDLLRRQVTALLEAGRQQSQVEASLCPLSFTWHGKHYLGAAHGLAGILTVLLQVCGQMYVYVQPMGYSQSFLSYVAHVFLLVGSEQLLVPGHLDY